LSKKRILLPVLVVALVLIVGGAVSGLSAASLRPRHGASVVMRLARPAPMRVNPRLTRRLRTMAWRWQSIVGRRHTRLYARLSSPRALHFWRAQARRMRRMAAHPPHKAAWRCIHHYEGSWSDSGDPYWGGLQMDRGFMSTYAPRFLLRRGWADRWTPLEQMWVAERAARTRGFYPWPNTARYCGLL
jgi:hypothetical protein